MNKLNVFSDLTIEDIRKHSPQQIKNFAEVLKEYKNLKNNFDVVLVNIKIMEENYPYLFI